MPRELQVTSRRHRAGHRSGVESLERRDLFATFDVVSPADDGPNSLREAIQLANAAPGHDTIRFHPPGTTVTVTPLTPLPEIRDPVTIDGAIHGTERDGTSMVRIMPAYADSADTLRLVGASGSLVRGLAIFGTASAIRVVGGSGVAIEGNHVGDPGPGDAPYGVGDGIVLEGATDCRVGGTTPAQRNVIFGNNAGVAVRPGASVPPGSDEPTGHVILGNYIGTNAAGNARAEANFHGVEISGTTGTLIGGADPAARNVISHGGEAGIYILNGQAFIRGNYIGTDATGSYALPGNRGILAVGRSSGIVIGGSEAGEGNVISGNAIGIFFFGPNVSRNVIAGNLIGLNAAGDAAIRNNESGIVIGNGAEGNVIGGDTPAARNVISGNGGHGVNLSGSSSIVRHNYIGTDASGTRAIGNGFGVLPYQYGLQVGASSSDANANVVSDNVISGNRAGADLSRVVFRRNFVGTDASGTVALSNVYAGVEVYGAGSDIGGVTPDLGNVIAGNDGSGVHVGSSSQFQTAFPTTIRNNRVGVGADGTVLGNGGAGILATWANANVIASHNAIAHNGGAGVTITEGAKTISVLANSIHSNGGLGIDLVPTARTDALPNALQAAPEIVSAGTSELQTFVRGVLRGAAGATFRVEFFSSAAADPSGFGEGETFLGSIDVATDATGRVAFAAAGLPPLPAGGVVTSTATRTGLAGGAGQTSEFSKAVGVPAPDLAGPRVTAVFVKGSQWSSAFLTRLVRARLGTVALGYAVPTGPAQTAPLPWTNVDEVSVRFSEPVSLQGAEALLSSRRFGALPIASTRFDEATQTLTWKLVGPLEADRVTLSVFADRITDLSGNALDGDWTDTQPFPSGDGARGRDFHFSLNALPGDVTRDGVVDAEDAVRIRERAGASTDGIVASYSPLADVNADGAVNVLDLATVRRRQSTTLPAPWSGAAVTASSVPRRERPGARTGLASGAR